MFSAVDESEEDAHGRRLQALRRSESFAHRRGGVDIGARRVFLPVERMQSFEGAPARVIV